MYSQNRRRDNTEKIILIMLVINYSFMIFSALKLKWSTWLPTFMVTVAAVSVISYVGSYFDYEGRAKLNSILIVVCFVLYSMHIGDIGSIIVPLIAQTVLIGFYDIDGILLYNTIALSVIVFYHAVILKSFTLSSIDDIYNNLVPIGNAYLVIFYIHLLGIRRRRRDKRLGQVEKELKEAEQSKDDFMANVSHEIRTPINSINGMSEIMLQNNPDEKTRLKVENIQMSCKRLNSLVDDLIDFSDLRTGKYEINVSKYSVDSLINDIVEFAYVLRKNKDIEIIADCDSTIPCELFGDEAKIKRVVYNIISNAAKFTSIGCIAVKIGYRREFYGINLVITVKDTGIGMDKRNIEKIFSSFNQADTKRNRQEGGVGLGLPIARAIIEQMNGTITVSSEPAVGSEFKVVIPQRVANQEPVISAEFDTNENVLAYLDMEQFHLMQMRDEYKAAIDNMSKNLKIPMHMCHNLAEFKRRVELNRYTHYFISYVEYSEDKDYFNQLAEKENNLIVVIDTEQEEKIESDRIIKLMKPIYVFSAAMALLGKMDENRNSISTDNYDKFTAPQARVLVVDDDKLNLNVAVGLLKTFKIEADTALSGEEALKMVDSGKYDIIFLDHMMPDMDGIETFRRLRKKNGFYFMEVPVIALTANTVLGAREMFLKEGFENFLPKPVEMSELKKILKMYLPEDKIIVGDSFAGKETDSVKTVQAKEQPPQIKTADFIDYKQGILYCGSRENLMKILKVHIENGKSTLDKIKQAYEEADWKNYVIYVHGLKSSMKSVGINKLSDMAKNLELAGKEDDTAYIKDNNDDFVNEYIRVLDGLKEMFKDEECEKKQRSLIQLTSIQSDELSAIYSAFEEAVYSFDESNMLHIINDLNGCSYGQVVLADRTGQIEQKIRNSDYMSALDMLKKIIDELLLEGDDNA